MEHKYRFWKKLSGSILSPHGQLIYSIFLVLLIPSVIIFNVLINNQRFVDIVNYQNTRQAWSIYDTVDAMLNGDISNPAAVQEKLDRLVDGPEEVRLIDVMIPTASGKFKIIASTLKSTVGEEKDTLNNEISWQVDRGVFSVVQPSTEDIAIYPELAASRYVSGANPLHDAQGNKIGLVRIRMSLREIDNYKNTAYLTSMVLLLITIAIVLLLLFANARLFGYVLLFNKLKEVDQMKDEFISMASHELRTPITAIKGYISMFLEGSFGVMSDAGKKGLTIIEASIRRLGDLVEDLLNVSRIEQSRLEIKLAPVNLTDSIRQTLDELTVSATAKKLQLSATIDGVWPPVMADSDKLRQVLVNIIGNAIKYTKQGSVTVSLKNQKDTILVKVKDTGIGIAAKDREKLFSKFYRVESEQTKGIVGTGLGLWITKQIISLMGGEVFVDSIEGVGTEFSFTLKKATV